MRKIDEILAGCRVPHKETIRLKDYPADWAGDRKVPKEERRKLAEEILSQDISQLAEKQELLYASDSWSILVVLQAMDAAGKDGTISHVMSGVNPQGCQVFSFKQPSSEELDHNFLWRCMKALPERGRIGIFNRSYYEEVLVVRVHPEYLAKQRIPEAKVKKSFWEDRFDDINNFERHLSRNGTKIVKLFLNVSPGEQKKRFLERINDPNKHWKFSGADLAERAHWDDYMEAYEEMINATSTKWAPWYVIPADHKWVTRAIVSSILIDTIDGLELKYPEVSDEQRKHIADAKLQLENEPD